MCRRGQWNDHCNICQNFRHQCFPQINLQRNVLDRKWPPLWKWAEASLNAVWILICLSCHNLLQRDRDATFWWHLGYTAIYHLTQASIAGRWVFVSQKYRVSQHLHIPSLCSSLLILLFPHPSLYFSFEIARSRSKCPAQSEKFNTGRWPCTDRPSIGVILWPPYASIGLQPQRWVLPAVGKCPLWWSPQRVKVVTPLMITAVWHPSSQVWTPRRKMLSNSLL